MSRHHLLSPLGLLLTVLAWGIAWGGAQAQPVNPATAPDVCAAVRSLMARQTTPYQLPTSGGETAPDTPQTVQLADGYAHFHVLNVRRPASLTGAMAVRLNFSGAPDGLEYALFRGMTALEGGFRPLEAERVYNVSQDGLYTLVVRRVDVRASTPASYTLTASFPGGEPAALANVRDDTRVALLPAEDAPRLIDGQSRLRLPSAVVRTHADAVTSVASRGGSAAQVRYGTEGSLLLGAWANDILLLGGDLTVLGALDATGAPERIFFVQGFGHTVNLSDENLATFVDASGTSLTTGWGAVRGVWMLRDCVGMLLRDGRTFTAPTVAGARRATFTGALDDFDIRLNAPNAQGSATAYSFDLNWTGIAPGSETRLADGLFTIVFDGDKRLELEETTLGLARSDGDTDSSPPVYELTLGGRSATLALDFANLDRLRLSGSAPARLDLAFNDQRGSVQRTLDSLLRFESIGDVIRIIAQPDGVQPGEQRVWLGKQEGFIEIVTPAGLPPFDSTRLPGEPGYFPRALNNLGGECYPVNTMLPQANCPPNGEVNPANGNLWYAVTDLSAAGGLLDLTLARSYNSLAASIDGPFGPGWSTAFALDYDVMYDDASASRVMLREENYRVGLNLTWAPRGIITFTTPSGSRHTFASSADAAAGVIGFQGGTLRAITMPDWTLQRASLRDPRWLLRQTDGLTYEFDRAGRLLRYGYPDAGRWIAITYDRASQDGPAQVRRAVISDDPSLRVLELEYDTAARITRAVLRDVRTGSAQETRYTYDNGGRLVGVEYADGSRARYQYDAQGRLLEHDDPRAPVAPVMAYRYDGSLPVEITIRDGQQTYLWRQYRDNSPASGGERRIVVTEPHDRGQALALAIPETADSGEPGAARDTSADMVRTYTYTLVANTPLREPGNSFTLRSVSSPIPDTGTVDSEAASYTWDNGLLTLINARTARTADGGARNSTTIGYHTRQNARTGLLAGLGLGVTGFTVFFGENDRVNRALFADGSELRYSYDESGALTSITDRSGAVYRITGYNGGLIAGWTRENDGVSWAYSYNSVGLVTAVDKAGHRVTYTYDGFGRLTGMQDALLGAYTLDYSAPESCAGAGTAASGLTVRDEAGVTYGARFDVRGRLIEAHLTQPDTARAVLRCTTWTYDVLGRLLSETTWASPDDPLTTTYTYTHVVTPLAGSSEASRPRINGLNVTVQHPDGRRQTYTYDLFERVRQVEDSLRRITRYDYTYDNLTGPVLTNGLRITQTDLLDTQVVATLVYEFDALWQLRSLTRTDSGNDPLRWEFAIQILDSRRGYTEMRAPRFGGILLQNPLGVQPSGVRVTNPAQLGLPSGTTQPTLSYNTELDALGRVLRADVGGEITAAAYCPTPAGGQTTQVWTRAEAAGVYDCARTGYSYAMTHDAHGRLTASEADRRSTRIAYTRAGLHWQTTVTFSAPGAQPYTWVLTYDTAGDLVRWQDEHGVLREYVHDAAGRLVSVVVAGEPEASHTMTYAPGSGLLARQVDGLGRGSVYLYDARGLLLVEQDVSTPDAVAYSYDSFGRMVSITSALGSVTTLRYTDPGHPDRVTEISDPTGVIHRYDWDDNRNTLTFSDIRGNTTRYTFDGLGTLWQITDALGRAHELHYNAAGRLIGFASVTSSGSTAARNLRLQADGAHGWRISEAATPDWGWTLRYNSAGRLDGLTDAGGQAYTFAYDGLGRLRAASADALTWVLTHQPGAQTLRYNDALLTFDPLYRLTGVIQSDALSEQYVYTRGRRGDLNITHIQTFGDPEQPTVRTYVVSPGDDTRPRSVTLYAPGLAAPYDNSLEAQTPSGQISTAFYNAEGLIEELRRETCMADFATCFPGDAPYFTTSARFLYDAQGRPIRVIDPEANIEAFSYDDVGNLVAYQTLNGRAFIYEYDALNRLTAITGPTGIKLLLTYDALDNVQTLCRTRSEVTNIQDACRLETGLIEQYRYDALGRLVANTFRNTTTDGTANTTITHQYTGGQLTRWGGGAAGGAETPSGGVLLTYDALAQLTGMTISDEQAYSLLYDEAQRLAGVSNTRTGASTRYTYDPFGRLIGVALGERSFALAYAPDGRGYRFGDAQDGVTFALDTRGLLTGLQYGDAPLLSVSYQPDSFSPTSLLVQLASADGENNVDLQLNRLGQTMRMVANYGLLRVLTEFTANPAGQVVRQLLSGEPDALFPDGSSGYNMVTGYDDNYRLAAIRIIAKGDVRPLYNLNFTYNAVGQRQSETRRFEDDTQIAIEYTYTGASQLTGRSVRVLRPGTLGLDMLPAAVLLPLLVAFWRRRWRGRVLAGAGLAAVLALTVGLMGSQAALQTQVRTEAYDYTYRYDAAGNLARVDYVNLLNPNDTGNCVTFTYDSANRLTEVDQRGQRARYLYDAHHRLIFANNTWIVYAGPAPLVTFNLGNLTTYYARLAALPALFLGESGRVAWTVTDGRDRVLTTTAGQPRPLTMIDPLGRLLRFDPPPAGQPLDPCSLSSGVTPPLAQPQIALNGMLWEPGANLYFVDGRAYYPEIGRFLQRDRQGPDGFGSVYDFAQRPLIPVQRPARPYLADGVLRLGEALRRTGRTAQVSPAAIREAWYPALNPAPTWADTLAAPTGIQNGLQTLTALPVRLRRAYNLPGPQVATWSGTLTLAPDNAPGQGGLRQTIAPPLIPALGWLPADAPFSAPRDLPTLLTPQPERVAPLNNYQSQRWQPRLASLHTAWHAPRPALATAFTPRALLDWLPQPLGQPQQAEGIVRTAEGLARLADQSGRDWVEAMLRVALPARPTLPPADTEAWRTTWFDDDTFGLRRALARRDPVPAPPGLPLYGLGVSDDWLYGR